MSNPIEHVRAFLNNVTIEEANVRDLDKRLFSEDCFIFDLKFVDGIARVDNLTWCGVASDHNYEYFVENVLPRLRGRGTLTVEWEDGSQEKLGFNTGNVTRRKL